MSIRDVENVIHECRTMVQEWDDVGLKGWLEVHTRYSFVDPILRALGWNVADPKECHPEYPRPYLSGWADYALFGKRDIKEFGSGAVSPDVIVECKPLRIPLDRDGVSQLEFYVQAEPRMREGVAVLTNGGEWWFFEVSGRGSFVSGSKEQVDILTGSRRASAQVLNEWLSRPGYG